MATVLQLLCVVPGRIAQSVICLTADPGVASTVLVQSHITFVEIDHEIISMVILLPSTDSSRVGCFLVC